MDAVEYLQVRRKLCYHYGSVCEGCPLGPHCMDTEYNDPTTAVRLAADWSAAHSAEGGIRLTAMERRFVHIYIEKGYLWAARDKGGELKIYKRCPEREYDAFKSTSPVAHGSRAVLGSMFPGITWEASPVCLPKLI